VEDICSNGNGKLIQEIDNEIEDGIDEYNQQLEEDLEDYNKLILEGIQNGKN